MSQSTRSFVRALRSFIGEAIREGLTHQQIAHELRQLRQGGREFARDELMRHYR
jgi:intergrase/recombinase